MPNGGLPPSIQQPMRGTWKNILFTVEINPAPSPRINQIKREDLFCLTLYI